MSFETKVAIIVALEREVRPLIKGWPVSEREHSGRRFRFFEQAKTVVVCGGIGASAARRATEAVIQLYQPALVVSAGFAGALRSDLKVGSVLTPRTVVDAGDACRTDRGRGSGTLVSLQAVANAEQKARIARSYGADAVDMEAAAVARGAQARGVPFIAVKAISDASDISLPPVGRFVASDGQFQEARFAFYTAMRPWMWGRVMRLARNSAKASRALCKALASIHEMRTEAAESFLQALDPVKS
jgi:adenosylhomocysteine nucleosidase